MDDTVFNELKAKASMLPKEPGVYQFLDSTGKIIYIGKAKVLQHRVISYFLAPDSKNIKLRVMVKKIADIHHIVTASESDALLLENNMIKKYQPRYNILLKDDKSFPWICVSSENFPRIFLTRQKKDKNARYFGPYTSVGIAKTLLELIREMYPLRTCHLLLTPEAIARGKYNVCLEYHIGNCKGACKNLQSEAEYLDDILQATSIIKGEIREVLALLTRRMKAAAKQLNFEEAEILKKHLVKLENYKSKSVIVNPLVNNIDVFSLLVDDAMAYVNFMRVVHGAITQVHTIEMRLIIDEEPATLIGLAIAEMQQRMEGLSPEVIVSVMPDVKLDKIKYTLPKAGDKFHLLQLSERNAKAYRVERLKYIERTDPERHTERIMNCMKKDLHLTEPPCRIECFDNSNIQGSNPVASCVVFINGRPAKKEYRCFNVKTVEGPNDFASMEEIVYRRYRRVLAENLPLPQLIVIDGGKGQVKAAMKSIRRLKIEEQVAVLGLAKRLEEIYFPDDSVPLLLNKNSETMKILMNIRDEAHRFGITFHRNKRSADFLSSELRNIKGVGDVSFNRLMTEFKTVAAVKKATEEELANVAGKRIAKLIRGYFDANDEQ